MASVKTALLREAATQGWRIWINSATGEDPIVERRADGVNIKWRPGQAKKMSKYLGEYIPLNPLAKVTDGPEDESGEAINVSVDFKKVLMPLVLTRLLPWVGLYTAIVVYVTRKI